LSAVARRAGFVAGLLKIRAEGAAENPIRSEAAAEYSY